MSEDPMVIAKQKNADLKMKIETVKAEYQKHDSRIQNLSSPETTKRVKELKPLKERLILLERILLAILMSSLAPRTDDELKIETESLRFAVLNFCKTNKIEIALWKSIES